MSHTPEFGYVGKLVRLVPADIDRHFENAYRWINTPEVTDFVLTGDFPMSRLAERDWFEKVQIQNETEVFFAVETLGGTHIGFSGIHQINFRHGTAITGTILGAIEEWGKGYGTDAAMVRARYCFDVLGLRQLYSSSLEGNIRSARMQEKVGYQVVGINPKRFWKRGQYRDETLTVLTRERFFEIHGF